MGLPGSPSVSSRQTGCELDSSVVTSFVRAAGLRNLLLVVGTLPVPVISAQDCNGKGPSPSQLAFLQSLSCHEYPVLVTDLLRPGLDRILVHRFARELALWQILLKRTRHDLRYQTLSRSPPEKLQFQSAFRSSLSLYIEKEMRRSLTTEAKISLRRGLELARTTRLPASLLKSGVASANDVTGSDLFDDDIF